MGRDDATATLAKNYPWAFGPRLGAAYQINPRTVFRAGWGIVYSGTPDNNGATAGIPVPVPVNSPAFGQAVMTLRNGIPFAPTQWPNFDPGQFPVPGTTSAPKVYLDQNAGRPARQVQWSIGLQREINKNLVVEAAYVANRGVWWSAPALVDVNALTPQIISAAGSGHQQCGRPDTPDVPIELCCRGPARVQHAYSLQWFSTGFHGGSIPAALPAVRLHPDTLVAAR